jgi:hypothetical protein
VTIHDLARETRALFHPEHPGPGRALATARVGASLYEVKVVADGELVVRKKSPEVNTELARFRHLREAEAAARLILQACAVAERRA